MNEFLDVFVEAGVDVSAVPQWLLVVYVAFAILLFIAAIAAVVISIWLFTKYRKYNKKKNSCQLCGKDIARKILDDNGLEKIKVKATGSTLFGNSYSHFFKKVRLRRLTWKKDTVTSLAMASQKSSLAILDKENDPDMKQRIRLTPLINFGPLACLPLIIIGVVIDILVFNNSGIVAAIAILLGLFFYAISFVFSIKVLKTEKKAQERAYSIVKESALATDEEIADMKELFRLYNIEYINNMIIALLELILRILEIAIKLYSNSSSSKK